MQTNPGTQPGPLMKIASGGELARFMLALKVVLADAGSAPTLIFDEIDTGVGGAVASTIGRSLKRLGKDRQVLCVTHLPQVAANGDGQWCVTRSGVKVKVDSLDREARIVELARMLGGAEKTARRHAAELLDAG